MSPAFPFVCWPLHFAVFCTLNKNSLFFWLAFLQSEGDVGKDGGFWKCAGGRLHLIIITRIRKGWGRRAARGLGQNCFQLQEITSCILASCPLPIILASCAWGGAIAATAGIITEALVRTEHLRSVIWNQLTHPTIWYSGNWVGDFISYQNRFRHWSFARFL